MKKGCIDTLIRASASFSNRPDVVLSAVAEAVALIAVILARTSASATRSLLFSAFSSGGYKRRKSSGSRGSNIACKLCNA